MGDERWGIVLAGGEDRRLRTMARWIEGDDRPSSSGVNSPLCSHSSPNRDAASPSFEASGRGSSGGVRRIV